MPLFFYATALILITAAAFLMWFFIFGKRSILKEDTAVSGKKADLICSAVLCFIIAITICYDFHQSLLILEEYGDTKFLHLLFFPVSALALIMFMTPAAVISVKQEIMIPGLPAILVSFLFILILNLLCSCIIHDHTYICSSLCFLVLALLCCVIVYITPRFSHDRYRDELRRIDGQLADARSAHYEAVKKSSVETRRMRHDIKNHLIAMRGLASQSRTEELLAYMDSIEEQIEAAAPPYRSGNDIADVIIADKYAKAAKRGLELSVSGDLAGLEMESADLVTILSNLLDNAIEAVSRLYGRDLSEEEGKMILEFRKNPNFIFIIEKNMSMIRLDPGRIVSAKNSPDHGFGITNIRRAVKKYGGEYNISCTAKGDLYYVETEILLPLKEK